MRYSAVAEFIAQRRFADWKHSSTPRIVASTFNNARVTVTPSRDPQSDVDFPFSGTLRSFRSHFPHSLVTPGAERRLFALGATLHAAAASWAHIECRLDAREQIDLIVQVEATGRATLIDRACAPRWPGPAALARAWARDGDRSVVGRLWLEFDLLGDGDTTRPPSTFIELTPRAQVAARDDAVPRALAQAISVLGASTDAETVRRAIARCVRPLPAGATLFAVGAMMSRPDAPLRLCLTGMSDDALGPYLDAVGWRGDWAAVSSTIAGVARAVGGPASHVGILHLDVRHDIRHDVEPRIGVEIVLDRRSQVRGEVRERAFLELLVQWGCCTPEKRDGLCAWPGVARRTMPHELWPSLALRRVNHVKLVHEPGRPIEAKAYLCIAHDHELLPRTEARL